MYKEKIINAQTGEETWRDYTKEEIVEAQAIQKKIDEQLKAILEKQKLRESALNKLIALGLTEEEIASL